VSVAAAVTAAPLAPGVPVGPLVVLALLAILVSALLSAARGALGRLTRASAAELVAARRRGATAVARLAEDGDAALLATAVAVALADVTAAVCVTLVASAFFAAWWQVLLVSMVACALLLTVVAGLGPDGVGHRRPAAVLLPLGRVLLVLTSLVRPLERLRTRSLAGRSDEQEEDEAVEELRDMVDRVSESEQIEADERELLQSVFELGRTRTREVMVPRTSVVTLSASSTAEKALRLFVRSGYSRVPVIGESVDDVVGVLYLKDVLRRLQFQPGAGDVPVTEVVRPPVFVPETKPVDDLMREMQQTSTHMVMVADEYGGVAGLVTIEDCLEELVGELRDEHDRAEPAVEWLEDGVVRVPARLAVDELGDLFGVELKDDDVDSAGGLLAKTLGKVPIPGAAAEVHGLHLQAERTEGRRRQVSTLLVRRVAAQEGGDGERAGEPAPGDGPDAGDPRRDAARGRT
jgi:CBS domain containing-hemolysin-like protein